MKRIYLSGPMTGYENYNYDAFNKATQTLREQRNWVFNPAEQFNGDQSKDWTDYMRVDIEALLTVDEVIVLEGWEKSIGARLEVAIARSLGLRVWNWCGSESEYSTESPREAVSQLLGLSKPNDDVSILMEAYSLVHGNRGDDYGHPFDDFSKTALIWQAILGMPVSAEQVALCMVGVKISREVNKPKRDNCVDGAGYFETLSMVKERREELEAEVGV